MTKTENFFRESQGIRHGKVFIDCFLLYKSYKRKFYIPIVGTLSLITTSNFRVLVVSRKIALTEKKRFIQIIFCGETAAFRETRERVNGTIYIFSDRKVLYTNCLFIAALGYKVLLL